MDVVVVVIIFSFEYKWITILDVVVVAVTIKQVVEIQDAHSEHDKCCNENDEKILLGIVIS